MTVGRTDGSLRLEIVDDGQGGADTSKGTGLLGLRDRTEAEGGTLVVVSLAAARRSRDAAAERELKGARLAQSRCEAVRMRPTSRRMWIVAERSGAARISPIIPKRPRLRSSPRGRAGG